MLAKPLGHLRNIVGLVRDDAQEPHRAVPAVLGYAACLKQTQADGLGWDSHAPSALGPG
jgi:hypothetical protein